MENKTQNEFKNRLNEYLSDTGKRSNPIIVCGTPSSLLLVGAKPLTVVINPNDIDKCLAARNSNKNKNSHNLTVEELGALPELLASPVMIFREPRTSYITIITDRFDCAGNPFVIGIELDTKQQRHNVNRITTMHCRERAFKSFTAKNGNVVQGFIPRMIEEGNLLAINKTKAPNFFQSTGLQLPERKELLSFV